jgi:hypothetical protein
MFQTLRTGKTTMFKFIASIASGVVIGALPVFADTTSTWLTPSSGDWASTTAWSTGVNYPNNGTPSGTNYAAVINATGSAYTVSLDSDIAVDSLTLDSADATLNQGEGGFGTLQATNINLEAGAFELGGTLTDSTVNMSGGSFSVEGGTLDGVTVTGGDLQVPVTGTQVQNGLNLSNHNLNLSNEVLIEGTSPAQTWDDMNIVPGQAVFISASEEDAPGAQTLTLGTGVTVQGGAHFYGYRSADQIINNGAIHADNANPGIIDVNFTNNGTLDVSNGDTLTFDSPHVFTNNGTLALHQGTITSLIPLNIGDGTLAGSGTINGNVTLASDPSTLAFDIGGRTLDTQYDSLAINGNMTIAGNLQLTLSNAFAPLNTDVFTVLDVASGGTMSGSFLNVASGGRLETADGSGSFQVLYGGNGQYADEIVLGDFVATVPEPTSIAMLCCAGGALLARRRSRLT